MRIAVLLLTLAVSLGVFAQQAVERPLRLSVMVTDIAFTESDADGSNFDGGFQASLQYRFSPNWSFEASYGKEDHRYHYFTFGPPRSVDVSAEPIELVGQYTFDNSTRWEPYIGLGARYVAAPSPDVEDHGDQLAPVVTGGVHFNLTPHFSLRAEGKVKLGDDRYYDSFLKSALGVGWRF